jgi:hypothetical protein
VYIIPLQIRYTIGSAFSVAIQRYMTLDMVGQSFGFFLGHFMGYNLARVALTEKSRNPMW